MFVFLLAVIALILGYTIYGVFIEKIFKISDLNKTPAIKYADGVDFIALKPYKSFLIQFLNIAGLGPVFGAILGAVYGPVCLIWIVLGSIFAGGVHDFLAGVISLRNKGRSIDFWVELFFGKKLKAVFFIGISILLILVGAIFAKTPAQMLSSLTDVPFYIYLAIIFAYYFLATILPIDKIIGKLYPLFALCLIISTVSLLVVLLTSNNVFYNDFSINQHPKGLPIFPLMFITIACGAISGFHATQSPLMARCITNEKYARPVFYGAMILEGFIALVWATLGIVFYENSEALLKAIEVGGMGGVVSQIATNLLGPIGGSVTMVSIILLTITSGDTSLRSARLCCADFLHIDQKNLIKRLVLSIFILGFAVVLSFINLETIWLYFGWANQMLAMLTLWLGTIYLSVKKSNYWIALIPAIFMSVVCATYFAYAPVLLNLDIFIARIFGIIVALLFTFIFFITKKRVHS